MVFMAASSKCTTPPPRTGPGGGGVRSSSREPRPLTGGREGERERYGRAGRGMVGMGDYYYYYYYY